MLLRCLDYPTLAVGDWNQVPEEENSTAWEYKQGLEVVRTNEDDETTRWDGNRRVDYFLADEDMLEGEVTSYDERKISDHKIIKLDIPIGQAHKAEPERRSKKGAQWTNPGGFTNKEWKKLMQEIWDGRPSGEWWTGSVPNVDDNWKKFVLLLDQFHRTAHGKAKKQLEERINGVDATEEEREGAATAIARINKEMKKNIDKMNKMGDPDLWT